MVLDISFIVIYRQKFLKSESLATPCCFCAMYILSLLAGAHAGYAQFTLTWNITSEITTVAELYTKH